MVRENIEIVATLINNVSNKTKAVIQSTTQMREGLEKITTSTYEYGTRSKKIPKILDDMQSGVLSQEEGMKKLNNTHAKLISTQDKTIRGARRFNFAWLSIMFTGMALNRVFSGLIQSSLELWGINELLGEATSFLLLPIFEDLSNTFYDLIGWIFGLSEGTRYMIGVFIMLMAVLTGVIIWVAMLKLGLQGIGMEVGKGVGASLLLFLKFFGIVAGLTLMFIGLKQAIQNWGKDTIATIQGVSTTLIGLAIIVALLGAPWIGLVLLIIGIFGYLIAFIIKNWDIIKANGKLAAMFIYNNFAKMYNDIVSGAEKAISAILKAFQKVGLFKGVTVDFSAHLMPIIDLERMAIDMENEIIDKQNKMKEETEKQKQGVLQSLLGADYMKTVQEEQTKMIQDQINLMNKSSEDMTKQLQIPTIGQGGSNESQVTNNVTISPTYNFNGVTEKEFIDQASKEINQKWEAEIKRMIQP